MLRRDLSEIVLKHDTDSCFVLSGALAPSPYSGEDVPFDQQEDNSLDIDHVVAVSDAWQTGAAQWDDQTRRELGNDPLNLLAVEEHLNQPQGDGDAATWLPPNTSYLCEYVSRQIALKAKYGLTAAAASTTRTSMPCALRAPTQSAPGILDTRASSTVMVTASDVCEFRGVPATRCLTC